MEDYIFLIIAVVLSIFGAINQNRKKKAAENLPEEVVEKPRNFFMDQILGEDFLEETEEVRTPPVKIQPIILKKSKSELPTGKNYQPSRFKSTLPDRPKRESILTMQKQPEVEEIGGEEEESISYLEDFSLRKAFVYSEIMSRKY
jgi:hypothetical protein